MAEAKGKTSAASQVLIPAVGLPCYLETANEPNLRFYGSHGFEVVEDVRAAGGVRVWGLLRRPR